MHRPQAFALALIAPAVFAATALSAQTPKYHVVKRVVIGHTWADYLAVDPVHRRLYGISDKVVDVDDDSVVDSIPGGGGGYVIAADLNRGLVRRGVVFNLTTLAVEGHLDARGDGVLYDRFTHRGFTWEGPNAWVVDMRTGRLVTKSTLGGGLESGASDGRGSLFFNVEDSGYIRRVNARTLKIEGTWKIADCGHAQGLSMDVRSRRLFMACDTDLVVVNANTGAVVTRIRVPGRADQDCFDSVADLAFNPSRQDSTITVVHEESPERFSVVGTFPTGGAARSCAVDPKTHKVYTFYFEGTSRANAQLVMAVLAP